MLALKAASLARGHSGVRRQVVDTLLALHNAGLVPVHSGQGSVGASGDLAPLAHMTLALIGEGEVRVGRRAPARARGAGGSRHRAARAGGQGRPGADQRHADLDRARTARPVLVEPVLEAALVIGALTVDAARGSDGPFDPRIHALRGQPGQIDAAHAYRALLAGSAIRALAPGNDDRVQDPYSLRCQPQVMGACLDQIAPRGAHCCCSRPMR